jgi:hypothetical protein
MVPCSSTLKTQTTPAAAIKNVSAHCFVHRARTKMKVGNPLAKHVPVDNTKIKVGNPLAKHVPVVLTALLVPQAVRILQLLVLLEPMPVAHQLFVIYAVLGNTMINKDKPVAKNVKLESPILLRPRRAASQSATTRITP